MAVKRRDRFKCILCGSNKNVVAHHIKRWADAPELRFVVSNGVCLCDDCHDNKVTGNEAAYEIIFAGKIISQDNRMKILFWKKRGFDGKG